MTRLKLRHKYPFTVLLFLTLAVSPFAQQAGDLRRTALKSASPSDEIVRLDIDRPHPDVVPLIDTQREGWKGLHEQYRRAADQSWREAQQVYRAAWRRGLTTPETDARAFASTTGERHDHAYWLKEKLFRRIRLHLQEITRADSTRAASYEALSRDLTRRIAEVPGR